MVKKAIKDARKRAQMTRAQLVDKLQAVEDRARNSTRRPTRAGFYIWRLSVQVVRQWSRNRGPTQAAASAFQTALALVPALAVALAAFRLTASWDAERLFLEFIGRKLTSAASGTVTQELLTHTQEVRPETLGLVGLTSTLLIAFVLYNGLERNVNFIWRIGKKRGFLHRLGSFVLSVGILPLLFGASLYLLTQLGLYTGGLAPLISFATSFLIYFCLGRFLPARRVPNKAVVIGALFTAVSTDLVKIGFALYLGNGGMTRYAGLYGAMATVPLSLLFLYWTWLMLYLGIEISHAVTNLRALEGARAPDVLTVEEDIETHLRAHTAIELLGLLADESQSRQQLAQKLELSDDLTRILCERLMDADFVRREVGDPHYQLTRSPEAISVSEVLEQFDDVHRLNAPRPENPTRLGRRLAPIFAELEGLSLADLLRLPVPKPPGHIE